MKQQDLPKAEFSPDPEPPAERLPIDPPRYSLAESDLRAIRAIRDRVVARSAPQRS